MSSTHFQKLTDHHRLHVHAAQDDAGAAGQGALDAHLLKGGCSQKRGESRKLQVVRLLVRFRV